MMVASARRFFSFGVTPEGFHLILISPLSTEASNSFWSHCPIFLRHDGIAANAAQQRPVPRVDFVEGGKRAFPSGSPPRSDPTMKRIVFHTCSVDRPSSRGSGTDSVSRLCRSPPALRKSSRQFPLMSRSSRRTRTLELRAR